MLIATEKAAYFLEDDGRQKEPFHVYEGNNIAHVEEGSHLLVIALTKGDIILIEDGKTEQLPGNIKESIESLAMLKEVPLNLLIGTEPPHIYRLKGQSSLSEAYIVI